MKWQRAKRSGNVEDRRGRGMGGFGGGRGVGGLGLGGLAIVVVVSLVMGKNPLEILSLLAGGDPTMTQSSAPAPVDDETSQFVAAILGSTEAVWSSIFGQQGQRYPAPRLVLFSGHVASACGSASAAVGPFYCPADNQVYLDTSFFQAMRAQLGGGGDFAEAYVIAHEVGHHIQTLTGVAQQVNDLRLRGGSIEGDDGPLVRQELQADCYAGVWAGKNRNAIEPGDFEEGMQAASSIGDDKLTGGRVSSENFTHGTSAQRVSWFKRGLQSGRMEDCDTFK